MRRCLSAVISLCAVAGYAARSGGDEPPGHPLHSIHGEAFDEGPRQQAWKMEGMGKIDFPVTAAGPEAKQFFLQGVAQLHTFYYFEAERSFRQTALLDPKCAMAYWGMAMANQNNVRRAQGFLKKAEERAAEATERERKYIAALAAYVKEGAKDEERRSGYREGMEALVMAYPEDVEAKAFLAWHLVSNLGGQSKVAVNQLVEDVLRRSPDHPGAHHYRIHLWDGRDPAQALADARAYHRSAPGIAHAWHMPGHIYNGLSMWKEAAYQQEGSARVDHAHLLRHDVLPFQIHNYAHNEFYLIANLAHLGRVHDAIDFAKNLIETPRDPELNSKSNGGSAQRQGRFSLMRVYTRYERWDEILADPFLDWSDVPEEQAWRAYSRGLARLGKSDRAGAREEAARLEALAAEAAKRSGWEADLMQTARLELSGRLAVAEGKLIEGFDQLEKGARLQAEKFKGDLSGYPRPFLEVLGYAHLEAHDWGLAQACFREALEQRKDTPIALAGLVEASAEYGKRKEAAEAYQAFLAAARNADPDLPCRRRLEPLVASLVAQAPAGETAGLAAVQAGGNGSGAAAQPQPAADIFTTDLTTLGPRFWTPAQAPDFTLEDSRQSRLSLADYRGKNVLLVFYLGGGCSHCMEQLILLGKEKSALSELNAQVLAVSEDTPERNRELLAGPRGAELPFPLLSDPGRRTARLYQTQDTFEDLPLHGTFIIDGAGKKRWFRIGLKPFLDVAFLKSELERVNRLAPGAAVRPVSADPVRGPARAF